MDLKAFQLFKQEMGDEANPDLCIRSKARVDTGLWLMRSPMWICVVDECLALVVLLYQPPWMFGTGRAIMLLLTSHRVVVVEQTPYAGLQGQTQCNRRDPIHPPVEVSSIDALLSVDGGEKRSSVRQRHDVEAISACSILSTSKQQKMMDVANHRL